MSETRGRWSGIILILLLASGAYLTWKFLPAYSLNWKMRNEVKDFVKGLGRKSHPAQIKHDLLGRLEEIGMDPEEVEIELDTPRRARLLTTLDVKVRYTPVVEHPVVSQTTTLEFEFSHRREFTSDW